MNQAFPNSEELRAVEELIRTSAEMPRLRCDLRPRIITTAVEVRARSAFVQRMQSFAAAVVFAAVGVTILGHYAAMWQMTSERTLVADRAERNAGAPFSQEGNSPGAKMLFGAEGSAHSALISFASPENLHDPDSAGFPAGDEWALVEASLLDRELKRQRLHRAMWQ